MLTGKPHGRISFAFELAAKASQPVQPPTFCQEGRETHWHQFSQPAIGITVPSGSPEEHCPHSGMYCQADTGLHPHQLAQPPACVPEVAPVAEPVQSPTYCKEPRGTHLHQSGRCICIFTFKRGDGAVSPDLASSTRGCSHFTQSEVLFQDSLESHWHEALQPLSAVFATVVGGAMDL